MANRILDIKEASTEDQSFDLTKKNNTTGADDPYDLTNAASVEIRIKDKAGTPVSYKTTDGTPLIEIEDAANGRVRLKSGAFTSIVASLSPYRADFIVVDANGQDVVFSNAYDIIINVRGF